MILVLAWHLNHRAVFVIEKKSFRVKKTIRLPHSPFELLEKLSPKELKKVSSLCIVFGMKHFSSTRQVALLANIFAAMFGTKLYVCVSSEDADWNALRLNVAKALKTKGSNVITPKYSGLPHITKKKNDS